MNEEITVAGPWQTWVVQQADGINAAIAAGLVIDKLSFSTIVGRSVPLNRGDSLREGTDDNAPRSEPAEVPFRVFNIPIKTVTGHFTVSAYVGGNVIVAVSAIQVADMSMRTNLADHLSRAMALCNLVKRDTDNAPERILWVEATLPTSVRALPPPDLAIAPIRSVAIAMQGLLKQFPADITPIETPNLPVLTIFTPHG